MKAAKKAVPMHKKAVKKVIKAKKNKKKIEKDKESGESGESGESSESLSQMQIAPIILSQAKPAALDTIAKLRIETNNL